jgi:hypothetical protein
MILTEIIIALQYSISISEDITFYHDVTTTYSAINSVFLKEK